jgi:hypothetical protein
MPTIIAWITKTLLTEKILKAVVICLGNYLVKSTKNGLDDKVWDKVKNVLSK